MVFHANIAWAAAPGDVFRIIFTASEKQFRFCRLFVLLVKGQTIWTHLYPMACRKRNSKNFQALEKIKHSRAHILWRGITSSGKMPYHSAIAPIKNHSQHCSHVSGVAVLYCRKGDHHAKSPQSVTTIIPRRKTVPDDQQNHEKE